MRHIGHLPAGKARVFSDFLVAQGIRHEVDREDDGTYAVWVRDEDHVPAAREHLSRFLSDPAAADFSRASAEAEEARARERRELATFRKRIRSRGSLFPQSGSYGVGMLTYALIVISVVFAVLTRLGTDESAVRPFFITDPELGGRGLPEVFSGQVWRLFTPMFLHFGPLHLVFNLMWVYQLGSLIEARRGTLSLFLVVVITELCSSLAQFYWTGRSSFGGMSGVVYGLAGFVWIRGALDRGSGLYIHSQSLIILLVWMVICFADWMGPVANTAHVIGLVSGMALGAATALFARSRS